MGQTGLALRKSRNATRGAGPASDPAGRPGRARGVTRAGLHRRWGRRQAWECQGMNRRASARRIQDARVSVRGNAPPGTIGVFPWRAVGRAIETVSHLPTIGQGAPCAVTVHPCMRIDGCCGRTYKNESPRACYCQTVMVIAGRERGLPACPYL